MGKKYEILRENAQLLKQFGSITVYRIRALKDFADVKAGDLGGWIESEDNLGQEGDCWVYDDSIAMHHAKVRDNARIREQAIVANYAYVYDSATIEERGCVCGHAYVADRAIVRTAVATEYGMVYEDACIRDGACIGGNTAVKGNAEVAHISIFYNSAEICGNMIIRSVKDYIYLSPFGKLNALFAVGPNNTILVKMGPFLGTLEEFQEKSHRLSWLKQIANEKEIDAAIEMAKAHILG